MSHLNKVCHLTSAHNALDIRIFVKECATLSRHGFDVHLVAPGKTEPFVNGIRIHNVERIEGSRFQRMTKTVRAVYKKAVEINADLYHLHDPELLSIALLLKRRGKKVIFDAHEDLPRQILAKHWIHPLLRKSISMLTEFVEDGVVKRLDGIVTATPFIRERFEKINPLTVDVNNFPLREEFEYYFDFKSKPKESCYIGSLSEVRGIVEVVNASEISGITLNLAGEFSSKSFESRVKSLPGWKNVNFFGFISRNEIVQLLGRSRVGLVILHPRINYLDSLPIKMFEYMSAGIPVIASDFPYWKNIVESSNCGICVDPMSPEKIAEAIRFLIDNEDVAEQMGRNGQVAVKDKFNWESEGNKLVAFYQQILTRS